MPAMGVDPGDWERLSALADGELPPAEAAALRDRVAAEPALAAALGRIKGAKARLRRLAIGASAAPARGPVPRGAGAALVGVVLGALAAVLLLGGLPAPRPAPPPSALDWHRALAAGGSDLAAVATIPPLDLRSAGLILARDLLVERSGGPLALRHYRGPSGCRVTHLVGAAGIAPPEGALWRAWTAEGLSHALLSEGMDPARFAALAARAEALTRGEPGEEAAPALAEATRRVPCVA